MAKTIFTNQTTNIITPLYRVSGILVVSVSGVLDGADVITYYRVNSGALAPIASCSWRTSKGEVLNDGADVGDDLEADQTDICFEIKNAGAGTSISLSYYAEQM